MKVTKHNQQLQCLLFVSQIVFIILFSAHGGSASLPSNNDFNATSLQGYTFYSGVTVMMVMGFGYLMTFLKWYGLGSVGFCLFITAFGLQWALLCEQFFHNLAFNNWVDMNLDIYAFLNAMIVVAVPLISFGAVIGKLSPLQILMMLIIELPCRAFVVNTFLVQHFEVKDIGGTISIHMFGCYFGLAVAWVIGRPKTTCPDASTISDMLSFIGTIFLWIYWPSFVGGLSEVGSVAQARCFTNVILSLCTGTMASFLGSSYFNSAEYGKFRPVDIQNACLAGAVSIGVTADMDVGGGGAMAIGFCSGLLSVYGFNRIQPYLEEKFNLHDTCGINNLHGMPSIFGAIVSMFVVGSKQAEMQLWSTVVVLIFAIGMGLVCGYILQWVECLYSSELKNEKQFHDDVWWEVAKDFGGSESAQPAPGSNGYMSTEVDFPKTELGMQGKSVELTEQDGTIVKNEVYSPWSTKQEHCASSI